MKLTDEQLKIVQSKEPQVFIEALAGTGKTTTLSAFARENLDKKILYLVYNRSMRRESFSKFPTNTQTHTINSFIYANMRGLFNQPLRDEYNINYFLDCLPHLRNDYPDDCERYAIEALGILNGYFNSKEPREVYFSKIKGFGADLASSFLSLIDSGMAHITHNYLMKRFYDGFDFSSLDFDIVLVDEAQDLNRAMANIIERIPAKQKVYVGDIYQAIYGFRDTINIFKGKENRYSLTNSYRFGENIADIINTLTARMFGAEIGIRGCGYCSGDLIMNENELIGPHSAYITRTNAHLFEKAFELAQKGLNISIPFEWDITKRTLMNVFYLSVGLLDKIDDMAIKKYGTFKKLDKVTQMGGDINLRFYVKVVQKYKMELLENIEYLEKRLTAPKHADRIIITAHKSKGLEFFNVQIANDFPALHNCDSEELNLLYVAMTRAIEKLMLNDELLMMLG